ncbi:hypothetical protein P0F65_09470 [Sphingomonas sp. I4]
MATINSAIAWLEPGAIRLMSPLPAEIMQGLAEQVNRRDIIWGEHGIESDVGHRAVTISRLGGAGAALGAALLPIHAAITRS